MERGHFNESMMDDQYNYYELWMKIMIIIFCLPVFIGGIIGNVSVIFLVLKLEQMRKKPTFIFIIQLAVSDLIILFFCMPFTVTSAYIFENWILGVKMCKFVMFMQAFAMLLSVLTLTAMNIERFFKIVYPLHTYTRWTVASSVKICVVIVIVAAGLSVPRSVPHWGGMLNLTEGMPWGTPIPYNNYSDLRNTTKNQDALKVTGNLDNLTHIGEEKIDSVNNSLFSNNFTVFWNGTYFKPILYCFEDLGPHPRNLFVQIYNPLRIILFFFIPLAINGYIYSAINRALKESVEVLGESGLTNQRIQNKKKLMKMLRWMVVVFAVCWFPYQGFLVLQALDNREHFRQRWVQYSIIGVSVFLYLHCISSPILLYKMNSRFRKGFHRYLCCCCGGGEASKFRRAGSSSSATSSSATSSSSMMRTFRRRLSQVSLLFSWSDSRHDNGSNNVPGNIDPTFGRRINMDNPGFISSPADENIQEHENAICADETAMSRDQIYNVPISTASRAPGDVLAAQVESSAAENSIMNHTSTQTDYKCTCSQAKSKCNQSTNNLSLETINVIVNDHQTNTFNHDENDLSLEKNNHHLQVKDEKRTSQDNNKPVNAFACLKVVPEDHRNSRTCMVQL